MQTLVSSFILSREINADSTQNSISVPLVSEAERTPSDNEIDIKEDTCARLKQRLKLVSQSKYAQWSKHVLLAWQCLSVIIVAVLDIRKITHIDLWYMDSGPEVIQCVAAILLTSSNAKTLFTYSLIVISMNEAHTPAMVYNALKNVFPNSPLSKIIALTGFTCLGLLEQTTLTPYTLGMIAYIWIPAVLVMICAAVILITVKYERIMETLKRIQDDKSAFGVIITTFALVMVLCLLIFGLAMINLYSGMRYWKSLWLVLSERRWRDYMDHVASNAEQGFRFITWLF